MLTQICIGFDTYVRERAIIINILIPYCSLSKTLFRIDCENCSGPRRVVVNIDEL